MASAYQELAATEVSDSASFVADTRSVLVINAGLKDAYVVIFDDEDTPRDATTGDSPLAAGAAMTFTAQAARYFSSLAAICGAGDSTTLQITSLDLDSVADATLNALTSGLTTPGSIGKLIVDNLDALVSGCSTHSAADVAALVPDADANAVAVWDALTSALIAEGSVGKLLVERLNLIVQGSISFVGGVAPGGPVFVYQGDDYQGASKLTWSDDSWGDLSAVDLSLWVEDLLGEGQDFEATPQGGDKQATLELTAEQTALMESGSFRYVLRKVPTDDKRVLRDAMWTVRPVA